MKRLSLLLGIALLFGMTQCKKNVDPVVPGSGNAGTVDLTVNVGNGSKVGVNTETGAVTFESGDVIYVSDETQGYLGSLSYDGGGTFSGSITTPTEGEHLYFYFLGNQDISYDSDTHEISVDIIDQSSELPVISCEKSTQAYTSGVTSYSAKLKNKCALVKFNVTTGSTKNIYFTGINNTVTFTMGSTEASYSQSGEGKIILNGTGSGDATEKWAILFPMEEGLSAGADGTAYSVDGCYKGSRPAIPALIANGFNSTGIDMSVSTMLYPEGTINGLFTINEDGDQVYFSQGNLQYQGSTATWRFAENQYDYVGDATNGNVYEGGVKCDNSLISDSYSGWIDLFGWGTSGYNNKYPYMTSTTNADYGNGTASIAGTNYDWGVYIGSSITNGGGSSSWRTLTKDEWVYLLETRANAVSKVGYATVGGTVGIIILPDTFTDPMTNNGSGAFVPRASTGWTRNVYAAGTQWQSMETAGAVFLPAAGHREGTNMYDLAYRRGLYSLTTSADASLGYIKAFNEGNIYRGSAYHNLGCSVRLVMSN